LLAIDKVALVSFVVILFAIGILPLVIAPIVEAGVAPVVNRLDMVQNSTTAWDTWHMAAQNIIAWLGGA
jgi:hypothetical protein